MARVRFRPGIICGLSLLLVLVPAPSPKTDILNSKLILMHHNARTRLNELLSSYLHSRDCERFTVGWGGGGEGGVGSFAFMVGISGRSCTFGIRASLKQGLILVRSAGENAR